MAEPIRVTAEWQPGLSGFCPACKLHLNLFRVAVEPGSVRDEELTVGAASDKELMTLKCPNCAATITVVGVKAGKGFRLAQAMGEGRAESTV